MKRGGNLQAPKINYFKINIITFLDILLALLIIFAGSKIANAPLGKSVLIFGFIMLLIATIVLLIQRKSFKKIPQA